MTGRLRAGTSGFAYPDWAPAFYPAGLRGDALLAHYATRLDACELNNTYYQRPTEPKVAAWLRATPSTFRFAVKAQRGGSQRALMVDPAASVPWLTEPLAWFGDQLGSVLFRVPEPVRRDDARLAALLAAWPPGIPLTLEFQHPSWQVDEVFAALNEANAALCATELPDDGLPPTIRVTGPFLYLRLRRHGYDAAQLGAWADRLVPFLEAGRDAYVFFRHDETGLAPGYASDLRTAVAERLGRSADQERAERAQRAGRAERTEGPDGPDVGTEETGPPHASAPRGRTRPG